MGFAVGSKKTKTKPKNKAQEALERIAKDKDILEFKSKLGLTAFVNDKGEMTITKYSLSAQISLNLADWIYEVFGE